MEFTGNGRFSKLTNCTIEQASLIDSHDVLNMLRNIFLHDVNSHFIVSEEGTYDDRPSTKLGITPGRVEELENAYLNGHTIVIKDLENWNEKIIQKCAEFKNSTNVHLYLSPANGTGFDWHTDQRDVYVFGQIGSKKFEVKEPNGEISTYMIEKGDVLFIPYGVIHRAQATDQPSVHLSFGIWPDGMTINNQYDIFDIPLKVNI